MKEQTKLYGRLQRSDERNECVENGAFKNGWRKAKR